MTHSRHREAGATNPGGIGRYTNYPGLVRKRTGSATGLASPPGAVTESALTRLSSSGERTMGELNRRKALLGAGGVAALLASGLLPGVATAAGTASGRAPAGPPDPVAATYLRVLLRHT